MGKQRKSRRGKNDAKNAGPTPPVNPASCPADNKPTEEELAKMVAGRISLLEDTKKKTDAKRYAERGFVSKKVEGFRQDLKIFSDGLPEASVKKVETISNTMLDFMDQVGTILGDEAERHAKTSEDLKNCQKSLSTFQKLCRSLQNEKNAMKEKFAELEEAEKRWREDLEKQFDQSIKDIKSQISNHETTNKSILEDNQSLRERMIKIMEQDQLYIKENELLKQTLKKQQEQGLTESTRFELITKNIKTERDNLTEHLKTSIDMNKEYNKKLEEYRQKYLILQEQMTTNGEYISQLKSMNDKLQKGIKTLHKSNDEVHRKAKSYQTQTRKLEEEKAKLNKQNNALSTLSRKLRSDLRELRAELELEKEKNKPTE